MNIIAFWDRKAAEAHTIKVTQSKQAIWRNQAPTRREAFALAKRRGWMHITTRAKKDEVFGRGMF